MSSVLFQNAKVGNLVLKNRIFMSAAASYTALENGDLDLRQPFLHAEIAKGGCALVPTGGVGGIHPSGRMASNRPMFDTDERIPSFAKFAEAIHARGAAAILQATHSGTGAAAYQLSLGRKPFVASFYLKNPKGGFTPDNRVECPVLEEEIRDVISAFGSAAARAKKAGFDGIQVHAAHESLLAQWFSPLYNHRTDSWGGSVENRCRLHSEILRDMAQKAGPDFPVILKLGVEDAFPGGATEEEGVQAARILAGQGNVHILEISQGLQDISDLHHSCLRPGITTLEKEAYFRERTKKVKAAVGAHALVTLQGGLRTPKLMEEIIEQGEADFVSMCRPYIREPGLVNRWQAGDASKATCTSCNRCVMAHALQGKPLACALEA